MAMEIATIIDSISALSVDGLKICDLNEIPEVVDARQPVIYPKPDGFITSLVLELDSFGGGSTAKMHITYNITYRLCYAPVASGRGLFEVYPQMVAAAYRFLDAVIAIDTLTGVEDIRPADALNFGPVADPSGNYFHGCDIVLAVMEFIN